MQWRKEWPVPLLCFQRTVRTTGELIGELKQTRDGKPRALAFHKMFWLMGYHKIYYDVLKENPGGWGGCKSKCLPWEGYGYFLEPHNMLLGKIPIQLKSRISCPRLFRDPCFFNLNFNVRIPTLNFEQEAMGKLFNVDQERTWINWMFTILYYFGAVVLWNVY